MTKLMALWLVTALHVAASLAEAQPRIKPPNIYRVIVLSSGESTRSDHPLMLGLRAGLRDAGYEDGTNLSLTVPNNGNYGELQATIARYEDAKVDVFVTIGTTDTALAKEAGLTTPIVFMPTRDPVGRNLVKSLARPGTNLTGLAYETDIEMEGKGLNYFKRIVPGLERVLLLYEGQENNPVVSRSLPVLHSTAKRLGLKLLEAAVTSYDQAEKTILSLQKQNINGVYVVCTNFFTGDPSSPTLAKRLHLPFYGCPSQVRKFGALASFAPDFLYIGRRGAWYVDQILKGAKPKNLPIETPKK
jgi:putative ABC transport system substrate-binding protein